MVSQRPTIRLSGFSRKTSFDGPSLNSSSCSSFTCPNKRLLVGSHQNLKKCDCDCSSNPEVASLFRQQQQLHHQLLLQKQQQRHHHIQQQQQQQRNHHLLLLQLQRQKSIKKPIHNQNHPLQIQKRPLYFPHPPPQLPLPPPPPAQFRPTLKEANTESDREGLEHFHRHLQRLHQLTCSSLENAIYFGGAPTERPAQNPKSKLKHPKSFSFRDIRDIGKKKTTKGSGIPLLQEQPHSSSSSTSPSSSLHSGTTKQSAAALKRRNTTRSAKDYNGLSRIKLLTKYWTKGKSSGTDSGNGGSERASCRSSESDDCCQFSNCSSSSLVTSPTTPKSKNRKNGAALLSHKPIQQNSSLSSSHSSAITSSSSQSSSANNNNNNSPSSKSSPGHKVYPISQNNVLLNRSNTVTYKVRYDIPSSWESEQLLSFTSQQNEHICGNNSHAEQREDQKHDNCCTTSTNTTTIATKNNSSSATNAIINRSKNKESSGSSSTCTSSSSGRGDSSVTSEEISNDTDHHIDRNGKFCTHCGRGPEVEDLQKSHNAREAITPQPQKSRKTNLFKNLTFIKPSSLKPKEYLSASTQNLERKGKEHSFIDDKRNGKWKRVVSNSTQNLVTPAASILSLVSNSSQSQNMVQQTSKSGLLARSKSQKIPEKKPTFQNSCRAPNSKLTHTNSLLVLPQKGFNNVSSKFLPTKSSNQIYPTLSASSSSNNLNIQPKVRFKELHHHRSEQCLLSSSSSKSKLDRLNSFGKYTRRTSSSSTASPPALAVLESQNTNPPTSSSQTKAMLPDDREYHSLYDCRIPRPKLRGIVPTHSYGMLINGSSTSSGSTSPSSPVSCSSGFGGCNGESTSIIRNSGRMRRFAHNGPLPSNEFNVEFTEISLQDDDSETSGFESEQNNTASIKTINGKEESNENEAIRRKQQQIQKTIPPEMTPAGKYFTDFKTLYHYQEQKQSIQKSPTPSRGLSFRKPQMPTLLSRSGKKKADDCTTDFLKSLPIFRKLSDGFFAKLADHISEVSFNNGSYIFRQGEKGDAMYFLVVGTAKATFKSLEGGKGDEIFLKTLHPGDFFGEKTFQTRNGNYTYNVISNCEEGVTCARLDREAYEELIYKCHEFKIRVLDRAQRKIKLPDEIAKIKLDDLRIVTTLGVGGFGRVELVTLAHDSSRAFALKKMKKCQIVATRQIEHIRSEKSILLETNCDFICKLYKTFKDSKYLYMLMECCLGGELWTVLRDRGRFEDDTAKFYIGCVLEALKYLHTRNIIYRDLKPENLLLDSNGYVKLVDFGFAKKLDGRKTWTFCGTPEYCAPEIILNKGHDLSADFWSLGVLMYELLTGTPPFTGGDPLRTYKIILQGIDAIEFPPTISKYALNLIRKLCRDNPADRLGAQRGRISDIKKHKWFDDFDWHALHDRTLTPPIIPDVRGPLDFGNFDEYPPDRTGPPESDLSGWDWDF